MSWFCCGRSRQAQKLENESTLDLSKPIESAVPLAAGQAFEGLDGNEGS